LKQSTFLPYFSRYYTFAFWLGFAYLGEKFGGFRGKMGENIFGFLTPLDGFLLLGGGLIASAKFSEDTYTDRQN